MQRGVTKPDFPNRQRRADELARWVGISTPTVLVVFQSIPASPDDVFSFFFMIRRDVRNGLKF